MADEGIEEILPTFGGSLTGVKGMGENAQKAKNPFEPSSGWGALDLGGENAFTELWAKRQAEAQTTTEGSLEPPDPTRAPAGASRTRNGTVAANGKVTSGVAAFASQFIGTPYVWGGTSPLGFDCSGFTQYVLRSFGISIPRVSYQQGNGGTGVARDQLQPGDLLFWDNSTRNNGADHVALYIGDGKYIEAAKPGTTIRIRNLGSFGWARRYT